MFRRTVYNVLSAHFSVSPTDRRRIPLYNRRDFAVNVALSTPSVIITISFCRALWIRRKSMLFRAVNRFRSFSIRIVSVASSSKHNRTVWPANSGWIIRSVVNIVIVFSRSEVAALCSAQNRSVTRRDRLWDCAHLFDPKNVRVESEPRAERFLQTNRVDSQWNKNIRRWIV